MATMRSIDPVALLASVESLKGELMLETDRAGRECILEAMRGLARAALAARESHPLVQAYWARQRAAYAADNARAYESEDLLGAPVRGIPFESPEEGEAVALMRKAADVSYWADNLA